MYKLIFIISGIGAVLSLALASYLSKAVPYSSAEPILLYLGGFSAFVLFMAFLAYSASKHIIQWVLLFIGWLIFIVNTAILIDAKDSSGQGDAFGLVYIEIFILILIFLFLFSSFSIFFKQYRQHRDRKNLIGMILSVLPVLTYIVLFIILVVSS